MTPPGGPGQVTPPGDLLATVLARELVAAAGSGLRVLALTSPVSLVAGLAARRLGAADLAIATGFTTLDGDEGVRGPASDTFVALARGRVGVAVNPAQLDGRGATNLSRIGGTDQRPRVALPGSRGLPDNNDAPAWVWYLLGAHSPRQLVAEVDVASGPPPSPGRYRRLLTPLGVFALDPGQGWRALSLTEGSGAAEVREQTGFDVAIAADTPSTPPPDPSERRALDAVDPEGRRNAEGAI